MSRDAPGSIRSRDVLATFLLRFQHALSITTVPRPLLLAISACGGPSACHCCRLSTLLCSAIVRSCGSLTLAMGHAASSHPPTIPLLRAPPDVAHPLVWWRAVQHAPCAPSGPHYRCARSV